MKSQLSSYNNLLYSIESLLLVVYTHSKAHPTVEGMSLVFFIIRTVYIEGNNIPFFVVKITIITLVYHDIINKIIICIQWHLCTMTQLQSLRIIIIISIFLFFQIYELVFRIETLTNTFMRLF